MECFKSISYHKNGEHTLPCTVHQRDIIDPTQMYTDLNGKLCRILQNYSLFISSMHLPGLCDNPNKATKNKTVKLSVDFKCSQIFATVYIFSYIQNIYILHTVLKY